MKMYRPIALAVLGMFAATRLDAAGDGSPKVRFGRDIRPILSDKCYTCHGPDPKTRKAKLRLDTRAGATADRGGYAAVAPGDPDGSELIARINAEDAGDRMPPPKHPKALTDVEKELLARWVRQGAEYEGHWAYARPVRPQPPEVRDGSWPRNAIDRFILDALEREGLRPSPEAERATLLRRLSLDLIGLPPTPDEVDAFLADRGQDAYEKVVDRLLASPEFGARWARPWLDAARYADSHGFQRDDLRSLWPYRDWVIGALNADMPFDRFTIEQLAGDLLPGATEAQKVATGFHRCAPINVEAGADLEETRINQVIDRVNTTAAVWLGTTLECAQCHDHKFDPFTQRDYYGLLAFFNNTASEAEYADAKAPGSIRFTGPAMPLADPRHDARREELTAELAQLDERLAARRAELAEGLPAWESGLASSLAADAEVEPLEIADFDSAAGAPHRLLDDHSVLLVGDAPKTDTYIITVRSKLSGITGFKLEALTDPSLPGDGPGRGDAERPNFVLNAFSVTVADAAGGSPRPVALKNAQADYSQSNYAVGGAIDSDPKTAWAIGGKFHLPHWATFETAEPVGSRDGAILTFTLVQRFGGGRTIGRLRLSALTGDVQGRHLPAEIVNIMRQPAPRRSPEQTRRLLDYCLAQDPTARECMGQRGDVARRLQELALATTLVMQELPQTRATRVFVRGDFRTPGADVAAATPAVLPAMTSTDNRDRLALARWLVDRNNPLTARVTVNRWWAELFGQGIVSTVEDFGIKGELPTHPELLDWLAVEFMDHGWSMKHVLRTIVLSATYRQSSRLTPELLARDDRDRLLARGPRFRMDAEMIRDNALAIAGLLSQGRGGPPIRPYQPDGLWVKIGGVKVDYVVSPGEARYRRGVYVVWKRGAPYPSFVNFDATARLSCKLKRSRSNTPMQALTLLNDPVYVEAAKALARRIVMERAEASDDERLEFAFRLCVARAPRPAELIRLRQLLNAERAVGEQDPQAARQLAAGFELPERIAAVEFAAWYAVAQALLNLDETITKG